MKMHNHRKKSRIRKTLNPSYDADSITITMKFFDIFFQILFGGQGESYIVLFHISQFDCFLFDGDIRYLSITPETCLT